MTADDQKALLRERRKALQVKLEQRRLAARETLRRRRDALRRPDSTKRRPWWLLLVLLLLLLLVRDCRCSPPPPEPPVPCVAPTEPPGPTGPAAEPTAPVGPIQKRNRGRYTVPSPALNPWITAFRLQVAARGPRLATCFVGIEQPGTLKWTAAVEPVEGRVSEHTLEPTLQSAGLSTEQRSCVLAILSDPPYQLQVNEGQATPSRISMVIEF